MTIWQHQTSPRLLHFPYPYPPHLLQFMVNWSGTSVITRSSLLPAMWVGQPTNCPQPDRLRKSRASRSCRSVEETDSNHSVWWAFSSPTKTKAALSSTDCIRVIESRRQSESEPSPSGTSTLTVVSDGRDDYTWWLDRTSFFRVRGTSFHIYSPLLTFFLCFIV